MKLLNLSKLALCALAISATSVWAGSQNWSLSDSGYGSNQKQQTNYFMAMGYAQFSTSVSGVGPSNGVASVRNNATGQTVSMAVAGAGYPGQPYGAYDSGSAYSGSGFFILLLTYRNGTAADYSSVSTNVTASW